MTKTLTKPKFFWFIFLTGLVLISNYALYNWPAMKSTSYYVVLGSIFDFLIVIPLLAYFLVIRKRYSLKHVGLVVLFSYGAAYLIIPGHYFDKFKFVPYIIGFSEGIVLLLELFILYKIITKIPKLISEFRKLSNQSSFFQYNLRKAMEVQLPGNKLLQVYLTEFALFYYSLFAWRKKVHVPTGKIFTYHHKTSAVALYIMLIHATVIESVGLHYLLHQWNEIVAYILLFLNIYGVLYFIAEIQATRLNPFVLTDDTLLLQVGLSRSLEVPLSQISELKHYNGPEKFTNQELKTLYDARAIDFIVEKPTFEILLKEPQTLNMMYGLTKKVDRIVLNVDEANVFFEEVQNKIKKIDNE